jgi:hypothetical protein
VFGKHIVVFGKHIVVFGKHIVVFGKHLVWLVSIGKHFGHVCSRKKKNINNFSCKNILGKNAYQCLPCLPLFLESICSRDLWEKKERI